MIMDSEMLFGRVDIYIAHTAITCVYIKEWPVKKVKPWGPITFAYSFFMHDKQLKVTYDNLLSHQC